MTILSDKTESRTGSRDRTERFVLAARLALAWERAWRAAWPASAILGVFAALGLFGLYAAMAASLHAVLLALAAIAFGYTLSFGLRAFRWPVWEDGARRVERDSALAHRPITEGRDSLAVGAADPLARELWRAHLARLLSGIRNLKLKRPSPGLAAVDRFALRYAVLMLLIGGALVAGRNWDTRLIGAFLPGSESGAALGTLDAWIDPPAYTGEAPLYLRPAAAGAIAVPAGSELVVRVHGTADTPRFAVDPSPAALPAFKGTGDEHGAQFKIASDGDVRVRAGGRTLAQWRIRAIPDSPPAIAFSAPPARTERDSVKFAFTAGDDYGVVGARAIVMPLHAPKNTKPLIVDLPLDAAAKTVTQTVFEDLTAHPFAGLETRIVLEAKDAIGQTGRSKPVTFRLPAKVFTDPLARALVEQRQNLALGGMSARAKAMTTLDALAIAPGYFYQGKAGIYVALRDGYWSLKAAKNPDDIRRVQDLLWQTALALEQNGAALAAAQLRNIEQALSEALAQGAPQDVIDQLMQRLNQAMQRFLQSMAQNAQPSTAPLPPNAKVLSQQDLDALMKAIQELAQTGNREKAQQLLAFLQNLLENMQVTPGSGQGMSESDKALSDAIQNLGDLMGRQRQLMDKTLRQQEGNPQPGDGGPKDLAQQQGQLKQDLDKILKGLQGNAETPQSLGRSGREMGEAQGHLGEGDMQSAGEAEKNALDALRQGSDKLAQDLSNRMGQGAGPGTSGTDPLGRAQGGQGFGTGVKVPDKSDLARARAILEELRKRAAERGRPKEELDYIDRLLKQF